MTGREARGRSTPSTCGMIGLAPLACTPFRIARLSQARSASTRTAGRPVISASAWLAPWRCLAVGTKRTGRPSASTAMGQLDLRLFGSAAEPDPHRPLHSGGSGVRPCHGAVDHQTHVAASAAELAEHPPPNAGPESAGGPLMDTFDFAVTRREVRPARARPQHPRHCIHDQPIVAAVRPGWPGSTGSIGAFCNKYRSFTSYRFTPIAAASPQPASRLHRHSAWMSVRLRVRTRSVRGGTAEPVRNFWTTILSGQDPPRP